MNNKLVSLIFLLVLSVCSGCQAVEAIFKAGMWWAFFLVGLGIILILWLFAKFRKRD